jgi:hypothetical protein
MVSHQIAGDSRPLANLDAGHVGSHHSFLSERLRNDVVDSRHFSQKSDIPPSAITTTNG